MASPMCELPLTINQDEPGQQSDFRASFSLLPAKIRIFQLAQPRREKFYLIWY